MTNPKELQKIIFKGESNNIPSELFRRGGEVEYGRLVLNSGSSVSFDTYFNIFPILEWSTYACVKSVSISIDIMGNGVISVWAVGNSGCKTKIRVVNFSNPDTKTIQINSIPIVDIEGYLFLAIDAFDDSVIVDSGSIVADQEPLFDPKIACCFCTYKREHDLKRNLDSLKRGLIDNPSSPLFGSLDIFVSDNGSSLESYGLVSTNHVHIFDNPNYGGSGGYARCMIETVFKTRHERFTHIVLMDDDAVIAPYVVERLAALLRYLRPEYRDSMIGAARFAVEKPWLQATNLGRWDLRGSASYGRDLDMRSCANLPSVCDGKPNYIPWFFCCIAVETVRSLGLPLPVFFQHDDVEYGLRCEGPFITMNGLCVWHPTPEYTRRPFSGYYSMRNDLMIIASHRKKVNRREIMRLVAKNVMSNVALYRYQDAKSCLKGVHDFYCGIDSFKKANPEEINTTIRKESSYEYVDLNNNDVQGFVMGNIVSSKASKISRFKGWAFPAFKRKKYASDIKWGNMDYSCAKEILILESESNRGILLKKSYKKLVRLLLQLLDCIRLISFKHDVFDEWGSRMDELRGVDFWTEYLKLDEA